MRDTARRIATEFPTRPNFQTMYQDEEFYMPITAYTTSFYTKLNPYLRKPDRKQIGEQSWYMEFTACLLNSLKRLPPFFGKVYRGVRNYKHSNIFKQGDVFFLRGFISTSQDEGTARQFAGSTGTVFEIDCISGRDISFLSELPQEQEVLIPVLASFITNSISISETP